MALIVKKCGCDCSTQQSACECNGGITLACRTRGGVATLVGFSELTSPSTPPKKYLQFDFSGAATLNIFTDSACANSDCTGVGNLTGGRIVDPDTGSITDTGRHITTGGGGSGNCDPVNEPIVSPPVNGNVGDSISTTRTQILVLNDLACHVTSGFSARRPSAPTYAGTLTHEDTEASAKDRLDRALDTQVNSGWTGWDESGKQSCSAEYQLRTTTFSFRYQEAQWKVNGSGFTPGRSYTVEVHTVRAPFGSASFTPYSTIVTSATTDTDGKFEVQGDVPNDQGFTTAVINADAHA